jgi:hypothetical protein
VTHSVLFKELTVLRQSIDDDLMCERFYHYPKGVGDIVLKLETDWKKTLESIEGR